MRRERKWYARLAAVMFMLTLYILFKYFNGRAVALIGFALLVAGYFTGAIAVVSAVLFSIFAYAVSLPVLSTAYASLSIALAKVHYMIFNFIVVKTLRRMGWYRNLELKVKNSRPYKRFNRTVNRIFKRAGLSHPHKVMFMEVRDCRKCGKKMPLDGRFCPYCSTKQR